MKYTSGGVTATLGQAVVVEVPIKGTPQGLAKSGGGGTTTDAKKDAPPKPDPARHRFSAWTRTRELLYANPNGGAADYNRAGKIFDACAGKIDDLVLLQTINIQVPKPQPDGPPTGKVVWDSDFSFSDAAAPDMANRLVVEAHKRGIALHAGYAVVDSGNDKGKRGTAFRKFLEKATADQIKDHATQCVDILKLCKFDGLSFDLEINGLSTSLHGPNIQALFKELSSQMGDMILSYAPYPFLTDGNAPSLPNMNAVPYSLAKLGSKVVARPQVYRGAGESMGAYKDRVGKTIKCALDDVGIPPAQFQIGVDYTGDNVFAAVRGDDMSDMCKLAKSKNIGLCIWRQEWPGSPTADNFDSWNKALNDGLPSTKTSGDGSSAAPQSSSASSSPAADSPPAAASSSAAPSSKPPETESADWRPHIGKDSVPDAVIEAIRKNRAKYPAKTMKSVTGKYAGTNHFDYSPPGDHTRWAKEYFQKKVDSSTAGARHAAQAFMEMLDHEGRPASFQTYDNQIVTWGVGQGAKGNGVHAFENLNKDSKMKKLLDDLGINYESSDYHVVDLEKKKVVSSGAGAKGNDERHIVALEAWRRQQDLMSAIIGLSEDEATREAVAEAQYAVFVSDTMNWPGQDRIFTKALFFMVVHMTAWYPAFAKHGFNVEKEFQKIGGTPSVETDKKLARVLANAFVRYGKDYFKSKPDSYADLRDRTKTHLWKAMRDDGSKEGYDPGELTYDFD